jgi:nitrate/TMAO reductase-like tetraheme cytochrome c subunit
MARFYETVFGLWDRLGRRGRIGVLAGFVLVLLGSAVAGMRQWSYMQHDNTFCTSCHLMRDPFQRFTKSAHAKLECHSCHRATLQEEVHQLYAVVVDRPTEITKHAYVPNAVCASCHVQGDSTRWRIIANTAGHRKHLESTNPRLKNVQCVTCHGVSLHQFAPVDQTCGQSGCHADKTIRMAGMGSLEIHCTTCHNFLADARNLAVDSLGRPLTPAARQCFSCHAMQQKIQNLDIAHDPHRGTCGMCHNPHTQTGPQQVTCTSSACHGDWRRVSFHRGVPNPERCTTCHQPHSWLVDGKNCTRCHQDVERQPAARRGTATHAERIASDAALTLASAGPVDLSGLFQDTTRPQLPRFSHGDHRRESCATCHSSRVRHGALRVRSEADCQRCHHTGPGRDQCVSCHAAADRSQPLSRLSRTFRLHVSGRVVTRNIPFPHERHAAVPSCLVCHSNTQTRAPDGADCALCHTAHHRPEANCRTCHGAANPREVHRAAAHPNCASSQCHGSRAPVITGSRQACLLCHADREAHMPGFACSQCHNVTHSETRP